jgi:hypothetical protein
MRKTYISKKAGDGKAAMTAGGGANLIKPQRGRLLSWCTDMGDLVALRLTRKAIYRAARLEVERMYRMTGGGVDPIPSSESRELFDLGWVEEVKWLDWETYCAGVLNRIFEGEPGN